MKRNAIIRIIIWSIVIVLLLAIMGSVVAAQSISTRYFDTRKVTSNVSNPDGTIIMEPETDRGTPFEHTAQVTEQVNVRSAPNQDATAIAMLSPGEAIQVSRYELVNGEKWVYITAPVQGWMLGKYIDLDPKSAEVPGASANEELYGYGTPADGLQKIEIEWVAGSITIESADVDRVTVKETMASDPTYTMVCRTTGDKLTVKFCEEKLLDRGFGIGFSKDFSKNLIIQVPKDFQLNSLEVDAAFAAMTVKNLVIREVEFDGASGTCDFENCAVDQLDLDTASGDVSFSGTLRTLDCDAASASVRAVLDNVPSRIDMDSMSGDLDLTLPDYAGFTLSMDAMSSDFVSDFETSARNNSYICGDGSCRISMDAMSGDVYIRKAQSAAAVPDHTEEPTVSETIVP